MGGEAEEERAAASPILGSGAGCNVCMFKCSGVCWLTVQIRPSYRGSGYLPHSHLMVSSWNMCPEPKKTGKHVRKDRKKMNEPAFAADGRLD